MGGGDDRGMMRDCAFGGGGENGEVGWMGDVVMAESEGERVARCQTAYRVQLLSLPIAESASCAGRSGGVTLSCPQLATCRGWPSRTRGRSSGSCPYARLAWGAQLEGSRTVQERALGPPPWAFPPFQQQTSWRRNLPSAVDFRVVEAQVDFGVVRGDRTPRGSRWDLLLEIAGRGSGR